LSEDKSGPDAAFSRIILGAHDPLQSLLLAFYYPLAAAPAASGPRVVKPSSAPSGGHTAAPAARPAGPSSAPGAKKVVKSGGAAAAGSGAKKPAAGKSGSPPAALSGGIASESDISLEECEARSEEIFSGIKQIKLYSARLFDAGTEQRIL
jgi:hypothetical protein